MASCFPGKYQGEHGLREGLTRYSDITDPVCIRGRHLRDSRQKPKLPWKRYRSSINNSLGFLSQPRGAMPEAPAGVQHGGAHGGLLGRLAQPPQRSGTQPTQTPHQLPGFQDIPLCGVTEELPGFVAMRLAVRARVTA